MGYNINFINHDYNVIRIYITFIWTEKNIIDDFQSDYWKSYAIEETIKINKNLYNDKYNQMVFDKSIEKISQIYFIQNKFIPMINRNTSNYGFSFNEQNKNVDTNHITIKDDTKIIINKLINLYSKYVELGISEEKILEVMFKNLNLTEVMDIFLFIILYLNKNITILYNFVIFLNQYNDDKIETAYKLLHQTIGLDINNNFLKIELPYESNSNIKNNIDCFLIDYLKMHNSDRSIINKNVFYMFLAINSNVQDIEKMIKKNPHIQFNTYKYVNAFIEKYSDIHSVTPSELNALLYVTNKIKKNIEQIIIESQ